MMYRYIEQRLEQRDFSVTDAIHLFEKVDQKNATQDDLDEFEILSRDIYYLFQKQLKLDYRLKQIASSPFELFEWFVFESYDRGIA
ncbi:TPA: hypothetical protein ACXJQT_003761 [Clostridioides difficile]